MNTIPEPERGHLMHNGRIHVTPESGEGDTVSLWRGWLAALWGWLTGG